MSGRKGFDFEDKIIDFFQGYFKLEQNVLLKKEETWKRGEIDIIASKIIPPLGEINFLIECKDTKVNKIDFEKYSLIVTYNGICFDIPFIQQKFPDIKFDHLHIDLRYALKKIGLTGGLKRIEKKAGIKRGDELADIDGFEAVRLWYKYKRGDKKALDLLIKYNIEDVVNLKILMEMAYERLKKRCFRF